MRRIPAVLLIVLSLAVAAGVGSLAYEAGFDAGLGEATATVGDEVVAGEGETVVRIVDRDRRGFWPGGLLFLPLVVLFWVLVARALFWGRGPRRGWGPLHGPGPWPEQAAEWHRRQHEHGEDAVTWPDTPSGDPGQPSPTDER